MPSDPAFPAQRPDDLVRVHIVGATMFGRITTATVSLTETPIIGTALREAITGAESTVRTVVVDLTDVRMINSMGLGMLVTVYTSALNRGAMTVLAGVSEHIESVLGATKLDRMFRIARTQAELDAILSE